MNIKTMRDYLDTTSVQVSQNIRLCTTTATADRENRILPHRNRVHQIRVQPLLSFLSLSRKKRNEMGKIQENSGKFE